MKKNANEKHAGRVIGFDSHPDSFTAALLQGSTPAAAELEKMFNKVPMGQLQSWAQKHTTSQDMFVLEASGNSFQVVRTLAAIERKALVLESCQMGKLKEAHANNDKISAVRIGKAYLAGTARCATGCCPISATKACDWPKALRWPRARPPKANCVPSKTGRPANGRSSKGCSWNYAMPTNNGITGAASSPRKCWPTRSCYPSSGCAASAKWWPLPWAR
jgi:hypothetical protein